MWELSITLGEIVKILKSVLAGKLHLSTPVICASTLDTMEAIKKKMASLKDERDKAEERAEEAERMQKALQASKDEVSIKYDLWVCLGCLYMVVFVW